MVNIFQRYILWYFLPKAKRALFKPLHLCAENALSFSLSPRMHTKFKSCDDMVILTTETQWEAKL